MFYLTDTATPPVHRLAAEVQALTEYLGAEKICTESQLWEVYEGALEKLRQDLTAVVWRAQPVQGPPYLTLSAILSLPRRNPSRTDDDEGDLDANIATKCTPSPSAPSQYVEEYETNNNADTVSMASMDARDAGVDGEIQDGPQASEAETAGYGQGDYGHGEGEGPLPASLRRAEQANPGPTSSAPRSPSPEQSYRRGWSTRSSPVSPLGESGLQLNAVDWIPIASKRTSERKGSRPPSTLGVPRREMAPR
ncbi:hypothetical protein C8F01DRAFT_1197375 [Mycena amicta]|nr:hypothetical protein C8F01DRAFT_1197375 [Mycena amicta]